VIANKIVGIVRTSSLEEEQTLMSYRTAMPDFRAEASRRIFDLFVATSKIDRQFPREDDKIIAEIRRDLEQELTQTTSYSWTDQIHSATVRVEKRRAALRQKKERHEKIIQFSEATKKLATAAQRLVDIEINETISEEVDSGPGSLKRKREESELEEQWEALSSLDKQLEELRALCKKLKQSA
jgi:hypothetical protein